MTNLLIRLFIKDRDNVLDMNVRRRYGYLSSITGILINLLLSVAKLMVGLLSGSISILADAANNLSDAGSSIISFVGFKMAARPADKEHPFGHARVEYITTLIVAFLILFLGIELGRSSIQKILAPASMEFNALVAVVLLVSIFGKLWLFLFNRKLGKIVNSGMMYATATDSMADVVATTAVLVTAVISANTGVNLDGYMGCAVALFICYSGIGIARENMKVLLGQAPKQELIKTIYEHIGSYPGVKGIHDLMVHNYGPNMWFTSVHVEVSAHADMLEAHDMIDNIERDFWARHNIRMVIHMDPIEDDDQVVLGARNMVSQLVKAVDSRLTIHDFRMVAGASHTKLIFDVLQPYEVDQFKPEALSEEIGRRIKDVDQRYIAVITVDREFVPEIHEMS